MCHNINIIYKKKKYKCIMVVIKTNTNRFHLFYKDKKNVLFWSQQEIEWVVLWEALIRSSTGSSQNVRMSLRDYLRFIVVSIY